MRTSTPSTVGSRMAWSMGMIALFGFQNAQAASGIWTNIAGGSWGTAANWSGGTIANAQNSLADFSTLNITGDQIVTLNTARDIGDLTFGDATTPSHNWTLNGTPALTLKNVGGGGGGAANINVINQTTTIGVVLTTATAEVINKQGAGTLILTNANTIGATSSVNVLGGVLLANNTTGSATGNASVTVGAGNTLGGSGTIAPTTAAVSAITVSGVLAPGADISTISNLTLNMAGTTGNITTASTASFLYQLGAAGVNMASFGTSDLLTIAGAAANDFLFTGNNINFQNTGAVGFYKLFDTSLDATTWSGLIFNGTTGVVSSGLTFSNLASGLTGTLIVGTASNGGSAGDIYLQVIPEPSAALLGGLGLLTLLRRRRDALATARKSGPC